ncbi:hypothetical protein E2C01_080356 [Portunus trituberculatus]|uniref:Uncharacterized protein n=1 Tax=Portunus trituberculatus TaxID=210409 RepID=A0A5B7IT07_PORTR|nr:hypothetical protein [Portunus trituberculatus]
MTLAENPTLSVAMLPPDISHSKTHRKGFGRSGGEAQKCFRIQFGIRFVFRHAVTLCSLTATLG